MNEKLANELNFFYKTGTKGSIHVILAMFLHLPGLHHVLNLKSILIWAFYISKCRINSDQKKEKKERIKLNTEVEDGWFRAKALK